MHTGKRLIISPVEYHKRFKTLDEARLYVFVTEINGEKGWRLPTRFENLTIIYKMYNASGWDQMDDEKIIHNMYAEDKVAVPVKYMW